jgi:hypothetical protein
MRMVPRRTRGLPLPHEAATNPYGGGDVVAQVKYRRRKSPLIAEHATSNNSPGCIALNIWRVSGNRWRCRFLRGLFSVSADKLGCNQLQSFQTWSNSPNRVRLICLSPSKGREPLHVNVEGRGADTSALRHAGAIGLRAHRWARKLGRPSNDGASVLLRTVTWPLWLRTICCVAHGPSPTFAPLLRKGLA